jgi:hypothetical protein
MPKLLFKNDQSMSGSTRWPQVWRNGGLWRTGEYPSCFERGKVGQARWRSSKKAHTHRLRRRIHDKAVIAEGLHEYREGT